MVKTRILVRLEVTSSKPRLVVYTNTSCAWKEEAGGPRAQGQPQIHSKFIVNLGYKENIGGETDKRKTGKKPN